MNRKQIEQYPAIRSWRSLAIYAVALTAIVILTGCQDTVTFENHPKEIQVIEVPDPFPVPGETRIDTIVVAVPVEDGELVRLLLSGYGKLVRIECVGNHEHPHHADICESIAGTLREAEGLP